MDLFGIFSLSCAYPKYLGLEACFMIDFVLESLFASLFYFFRPFYAQGMPFGICTDACER
jgi:hypothetical protein